MGRLGVYSVKTKKKYLETKLSLDDKQLVMFFDGEKGTIKNQIMQNWESKYMKRLASIVTTNGGKILEVGFGMGISAGYIQKSEKLNSHHIIECHPTIIALAKKKFSQSIKKGKFVLHEGFWEDIVKKFPPKSFDGILFDSCPLDKEVEFFQFFPFFRDACRLLKDNGTFTYFSDEPLRISSPHLKELRKAGFNNVSFEVCKVKPLKNCLYWKHPTIIAPIVRKS